MCLECAYHSYYDNSTGLCTNVDDSCKTWDKFNGECLTCFDGFGDAALNGQAVNRTCPVFTSNLTDPNCQCFNDVTCISCTQSFYLDLNDFCQYGIIGCVNHKVGNETPTPSLFCL